MNYINLHFFVDEKVVSRCIDNFEDVLPGQNKYIIVIPNEDYKLAHVKTKAANVYVVVYDSEEFYAVIGDLRQYKHVIIHLMTWNMYCFVSEHPEGNFTWATWGADLYSELLECRGYNLYYDKKALYNYQGRNSIIKIIGRATIGRIIAHKRMKIKLKALSNLTSICTSSGDYNLLIRYYPEARHLKLVHLGYYPIDAMISKEMMNSRVVGGNIIVGNNAYGHGNHVEVFNKLIQLNLVDRKIIVPLSYGDDPGYILKEGKRILGAYFEPLIDFMPLDDYNRLLLSSNIFIYGNYRQAAAGNIAVALYIGGKVFLSPKNPLLEVYRGGGCILYTIDELEEKIDYQLTDEEFEQNRSAILEMCSYKHIIDNIRKYFS